MRSKRWLLAISHVCLQEGQSKRNAEDRVCVRYVPVPTYTKRVEITPSVQNLQEYTILSHAALILPIGSVTDGNGIKLRSIVLGAQKLPIFG